MASFCFMWWLVSVFGRKVRTVFLHVNWKFPLSSVTCESLKYDWEFNPCNHHSVAVFLENILWLIFMIHIGMFVWLSSLQICLILDNFLTVTCCVLLQFVVQLLHLKIIGLFELNVKDVDRIIFCYCTLGNLLNPRIWKYAQLLVILFH